MLRNVIERKRPRSSVAASRLGAASDLVLLVWFCAMSAVMVWQGIGWLPPRPPTPAEEAAARPRAEADWRIVSDRLARKLGGKRPEFGAVWANRKGQICGLVNTKGRTGANDMTRFYTVDRMPMLRDDDIPRYFREWVNCVGDHWVELEIGTEDVGYCAARNPRATPLGKLLCPETPKAAPRSDAEMQPPRDGGGRRSAQFRSPFELSHSGGSGDAREAAS